MAARPSKIGLVGAVCLGLVWPGAEPATAQTGDAGGQTPIMAEDWLTDLVRNARPEPLGGTDVARSAVPAPITTTPLGQISPDAVGLLPPSVSGMPRTFWGPTPGPELKRLIRAQRTDLAPPLSVLLKRLLLAELSPPMGSRGGSELFLARVDKLLDMGALEEARALLERAGPTSPDLFRRWFDISLLIGLEDQACRVMLAKPQIAPTYPARIFCLARSGDWSAAVLTLNTARTLALVSDAEEALMARFLDPDLFEGEPPLPTPERITPLNFRMHEAIGEPLPLNGLPNAFVYAALAPQEAWKTRLAAGERLARSGALPPQSLMMLYKEHAPAASGGVWDRVELVQAFDAALLAEDTARLARLLPDTIAALRRAGLETAFARVYGARLVRLPLKGRAAHLALRIELRSEIYEAVANSELIPPSTPELWLAVAKGSVPAAFLARSPLEAAIAGAFGSRPPLPPKLAALRDDGQFGAATLGAISLLEDGASGDPNRLEGGIAMLRSLGFEDIARRAALEFLMVRSSL